MISLKNSTTRLITKTKYMNTPIKKEIVDGLIAGFRRNAQQLDLGAARRQHNGDCVVVTRVTV